MAQWLKDPVLSLLWCGSLLSLLWSSFSPWTGDFCTAQVQPKKKKKKKTWIFSLAQERSHAIDLAKKI